MTRFTSWFVALAAFSILTLGGLSVSEAAKKHPKSQAHAKHHQKGEIKVTVVDGSGKPVAGAKVHLHKVAHHHHKKHAATAAGKGSHASVAPHAAAAVKHKSHHHAHHRSGRSAVTDASGEATFVHVKSGRHRATANKKSVGRSSAHVSLKAGQTTSATIRLGAGKKHHAAVAPH